MVSRKRIAVLLGTAEELYQEQFLKGFLAQAFDYDYDVCVFAMYQKFQESKTREVGETSIFYLIDYSKFDGVVLLLDTIQTPGMAKKIEQMVKKHFSGPVLCVDCESDIFPWIEMEYYESAKAVISHLIEVHGYTDIAYVTGMEGHKHSTERLKAFTDCMHEHGLEIQEHRIFYGDYWYNGGEWMVEDIVKNGWKMPQAIACANDFMAIGAGKFLDKYGYRVPEDVALVGYDSVEEGKDSPKALTSSPIPRIQYGSHAARCLKALFDGRDFPKFDGKIDLFIGSSCGCHNESVVPKNTARERWDTGMSSRDFFSLTNHMNADLLCQTNLYDLMTTVDYYTYHIREFDSFHICLNEDWNDFEKKALEGRGEERYSPRILHVMKCRGEDTKDDIISFDDYFSVDLMLPEIYEKREKPTAYYFTTLHFEERSFGYAVVSYGDEIRSFNATYRMWLQSVMQELECFRRIEAIQKSNQKLEDSMIKDSLTGLHNYNGFVKQADTMLRKIMQSNSSVGVLAIDIKELVKINDFYGRFEGDRCINAVARILEDAFQEGECVCLGNGEMLAVLLAQNDIEGELQKCYEEVIDQINKYNHANERDYALEIYYGMEWGKPQNKEELERLANVAVSKKNGNKISERKNVRRDILSEEERKEAKIVENILDNNKFDYHFQPIVNAKNGEIFGYEALMRPDVDPYMPPPVVLKYAEHFERLYDVEKATFFNILDIVCDRKDIFDEL